MEDFALTLRAFEFDVLLFPIKLRIFFLKNHLSLLGSHLKQLLKMVFHYKIQWKTIYHYNAVSCCLSMFFRGILCGMVEKEYKEQLDFVLSRLKEERQKANMSQIELSFAAGLSQNQVNCIESGRNIPNLYTLIKLCDALKIRPEVLFSQTDSEREQIRDEIIALVKKL